MHDLITRDVRRFIREHGRYRFCKLYELLQQHEELVKISQILDLETDSILHWKTIFEMIGDSPFLSSIPLPPSQNTPKLELVSDELEPKEKSLGNQRPHLSLL